MEIKEIMKNRHSIRQYQTKKIEEEKREVLNNLIKKINEDNNLNIQIIYDDKNCFKGIFSKIAKFKNCSNYIALIGDTNDENLEIKCGYFGEKLVLKAQKIGLNTCWVGLTYGKSIAKLEKNQKQVIIIALGYGAEKGMKHQNKDTKEISDLNKNSPEWYKEGIEAALLAPTAMNQQKFIFSLKDNKVYLTRKNGFYTLVDLGIVKYHFEAVTGKNVNII